MQAHGAHMLPLVGARHPAVIYATGSYQYLISSYDTVTKQTRGIFLGGQGTGVRPALSPDGHWILFVVSEASEKKLELVRSDGKYAQTLYCLNGGIMFLHWSPDQKHIAFVGNQDENGGIYVLNLESGVATVVLPFVPAGDLQQMNEIQPFMPDAWLDNTHLAVLGFSSKCFTHYDSSLFPPTSTLAARSPFHNTTGSPQLPPDRLYALDIAKGEKRHQPDMRLAFDSNNGSYDRNWSYTYATNPGHLFIHQCSIDQAGAPIPPCSVSQLNTDGSLSTIYKSSDPQIRHIRMLTDHSLLLITGQRNALGLWRLNIDGSGLTRLPPTLNLLSTYASEEWAMLSPDANMYVTRKDTMNQTSIAIGRLEHNTQIPILSDQSINTVWIAGWGEV
ncbi:hypothetical protein KSD_66980 [Ktedonobacter sp. SOSP1-85]|uniref:TolB family protein n=1 Tax=Ktedonobacter sp. SOSP1-85 TaxID=2778367 RepID=UPI001915B27B|nr:hypothetical protein [Ktedonobacter sp. SOSP1-85]GHO78927.1 hypothetical protein KSD_66980 [Ktedonobacter sp. SOSP1-85]